nr:DUF2202 domain-containing protein [uncultured Draconibacterium sp.]
MKTKIVFGLMAGLAMLFTACSESATDVIDEEIIAVNDVKSSEVAALLGDSCDFTGELSDADIEGLVWMREEEKFAHDVYVTLYEIHGIPVFNNISKSESAHTAAVLHLLSGFGIEDPAIEGVGNFSNEVFTNLYNQLTETGESSLVEALKVGALIEETDIADLAVLVDETQNETIKQVYSNLLRGSSFHLKAFTGILNQMDENYIPTVITQEEFDAIVNEDDTDADGDDSGTFVPGTGECDGTGPNA